MGESWSASKEKAIMRESMKMVKARKAEKEGESEKTRSVGAVARATATV